MPYGLRGSVRIHHTKCPPHIDSIGLGVDQLHTAYVVQGRPDISRLNSTLNQPDLDSGVQEAHEPLSTIRMAKEVSCSSPL